MDNQALFISEQTEFPRSVSRHVVTARDIKRFAQAIGEINPLHYDEAFAAKTRHGGIVAPPLFCQALTYVDAPLDALPPDGSPIEISVDIPATRAVGGSSRYRPYRLVRPGDEIEVISQVKKIYTKEGKSGLLYFIEVETSFTDQSGVLVAEETATYIKKV